MARKLFPANFGFALLVTVFYLAVQVPLFQRVIAAESANLEDLSLREGDRTYYLHSTLSLFTLDLEKKFNERIGPYMEQPVTVRNDQFPAGSKYVLALYPYPAHRPGYALTAAALTGFFPNSIFKTIPRLAVANLLMGLLFSIILYSLLLLLEFKPEIAFFALALISLDTAMADSRIFYLAHSTSGLLHVTLALWLAFRFPRLKPLTVYSIFFVLRLAYYASTHVTALVAFLCLGVGALSLLDRPNKERVFNVLAATAGWMTMNLYFRWAEVYAHLEQLKIPRLRDFTNMYVLDSTKVMSYQPIFTRFIWDLRALHGFALEIIIIAIAIWFWRRRKQKPQKWNPRYKRTLQMVSVAFFAAIAVSNVYLHPVSRAMAPYLVLFYVGLMALISWGGRTRPLSWLAATVVLGLSVYNFGAQFHLIKTPPLSPDPSTLPIADENLGSGIKQFIERMDASGSASPSYLEFEAIRIPALYRAKLSFKQPPPPAQVSQDFKLIEEIFSQLESGGLTNKDIVRRKRRFWPPSTWGHEAYYFYGYMQEYKADYLKGPMKNMDFRSTYFFRYEALKALAK